MGNASGPNAPALLISADVSTLSGLGAGMATFLGTPSSANLAGTLTDETGSGAAVFATSPTLVTPALGTPASGDLSNCTGLPATALPTTPSSGVYGNVIYLVKAANQTVNNSTTFVSDNTFAWAVAANEKCFIELSIKHTNDGTADFKCQWTGPAAPTLVWYSGGVCRPGANCNNLNAVGTAFSTLTSTNAAFGGVEQGQYYLYVENGANAGTLQFQWAQNTATAVDTIVMAGSYGRKERIA